MNSLCASPVARIMKEEDALTILWEDGELNVVSHQWLRENAPENRHPLTGERLANLGGDQSAASPWSISIEYGETLVVSWAGLREVNRFPLDELRRSLPTVESAELALAAD